MSHIEDSDSICDAVTWISLPRAYILLNVVRIFSILALVGAETLLGFIVVNSFLTHTFFFFDLLFYINLFCLMAFLFITELPQRILPGSAKCYLATHWPLLSYSAGLRTLGAIQVTIGFTVLGFINNRDATSRGTLGETWWRLMCSSGVFMIFVGVVNICVTWICLNIDDGSRIFSARQVRDPGTSTNLPFCPFGSLTTLGSDEEKGLKTSPPFVQTPAKVHSEERY
ncbi:hypothetical protein L211DRAFT_868236 [Terfezia boudieri ATCC MYA-4762]|uniref:DUF7598 domain-containing protein n=1 Tax=Terfezia boudieri ATCC MYA-4762 TaxID=1051890 RepID=A0A3N4LSA0_9PEZI|nr:hypothetical protein L211DRAFT_868236 [Terfezia boudieri ATCC MYA-4762]